MDAAALAALAGVAVKVALSVFAIAGVPLIGKLKAWLEAHATGAAAKSSLHIIEAVVTATVADLAQTVVPQFKAKLDAGTLTPADFANLTEAALGQLKTMFGAEGIDKLASSLQLNGSSTEAFLGSKVKLAVYNMRYPNQGTLPPFLQGDPPGVTSNTLAAVPAPSPAK